MGKMKFLHTWRPAMIFAIYPDSDEWEESEPPPWYRELPFGWGRAMSEKNRHLTATEVQMQEAEHQRVKFLKQILDTITDLTERVEKLEKRNKLDDTLTNEKVDRFNAKLGGGGTKGAFWPDIGGGEEPGERKDL
jgi:hypothetical protein